MIVINKTYVPKLVGGKIFKKVSSNAINDLTRNTQRMNIKGGSLVSDMTKTMVKRNPIKFL